MYTTEEVAALLRVQLSHVRGMCRRGELVGAVRVVGVWRVPASALGRLGLDVSNLPAPGHVDVSLVPPPPERSEAQKLASSRWRASIEEGRARRLAG